MVYLLRGVLLVSPFMNLFIRGIGIRTGQALLSILLILLCVLFFLNLKEKRKPDLRALSVLFGYVIANSMWILYRGFVKSDGLSVVAIPFTHTTIMFLFMMLLSKVMDDDDYHKIVKFIPFAMIIMAVVCLLESVGARQFYFSEPWVNGSLGNPTDCAMYISAALPFVFTFKKPWFPLLFLLLALVVLNSASALFGAAGALLFIMFAKGYYRRLVGCVIIGAIGLVGIIIYQPEYLMDHGKFWIWAKALGQWQQRAWFGYGMDMFKMNQFKMYPGGNPWTFIHNEYIWILHSLGAVGLILFANAMRFLRYRKELMMPVASVISVAIMALLSVPLRVYPIALLSVFNLAILTKEVGE